MMDAKACIKGEVRVKVRHPFETKTGKWVKGHHCISVEDLLEGKWFLNRKKTDIDAIHELYSSKGVWLTLEHGFYDAELLIQAQTPFDEWSADLLDPKGYKLKEGRQA